MTQRNSDLFRLAVLTRLIEKSTHSLGRTALMKFAYLLQAVKQVPLGYNFKIYTYGPFDSNVLSDLSQAVSLNALQSKVVHHSIGYGYEYSVSHESSRLCQKESESLDLFSTEIDWVLNQFADCSASKLELYSTIVFAEQDLRRKNRDFDTQELLNRVHSIKPHFQENFIEESIQFLAQRDLINPSQLAN